MIRRSLFLLLVLLVGQCGGSSAAPPGLVITVTVSGHQLRTELAATPEQRQRGLMGRAQLAENEGMLFVYDSDKPGVWYWMKDTPTPLAIAFIDKNHHIINTAEMAPLDETTHYTTAAPCRYVLEVAQGWFARHGVSPGTTVQFILPTDLEIR
jgi:uncharacterized membrane protein (UPF0127 family)